MSAPGNVCGGLEPIKKRVPFGPFLCQNGLIVKLLKKGKKGKWLKTTRWLGNSALPLE